MKKTVVHLSYRFRLALIIVCVAMIPLIVFSTMYLHGKQVQWKEDALQDYANVIAINNEQLNSTILELKQKCIYITNNMTVSKALADIERTGLIRNEDPDRGIGIS